MREKLTNAFAELLLKCMKDNEWTTRITDDARINRKMMTPKGIGELRVHQLLRLMVALSHHCSQRSTVMFKLLWENQGQLIVKMADENYFEFVDEGARQPNKS